MGNGSCNESDSLLIYFKPTTRSHNDRFARVDFSSLNFPQRLYKKVSPVEALDFLLLEGVANLALLLLALHKLLFVADLPLVVVPDLLLRKTHHPFVAVPIVERAVRERLVPNPFKLRFQHVERVFERRPRLPPCLVEVEIGRKEVKRPCLLRVRVILLLSGMRAAVLERALYAWHSCGEVEEPFAFYVAGEENDRW